MELESHDVALRIALGVLIAALATFPMIAAVRLATRRQDRWDQNAVWRGVLNRVLWVAYLAAGFVIYCAQEGSSSTLSLALCTATLAVALVAILVGQGTQVPRQNALLLRVAGCLPCVLPIWALLIDGRHAASWFVLVFELGALAAGLGPVNRLARRDAQFRAILLSDFGWSRRAKQSPSQPVAP
jgi:hypothetical protein